MIKKIFSVFLMAAVLISFMGVPAIQVSAAALESPNDTLSTLAPSVVSNHYINFSTPTGVTAGQTITVTFPGGFNMGSVAFGDVDVQDNGTNLTLAATASGATWGAAVAGQVLTITSGTGTIAAGDSVTILIGTNAVSGVAGTHQITNPAAGSYSVTVGGTMADSGTATVVIPNNVVSVSGTVDQLLQFSLGSNSVPLGTLSSAAVKSGSHVMTLGTNATSGAAVVVTGATLTSGANSIAACVTGCTSTAGTAQFGLNLAANTTPSVGAAPTGIAPKGTVSANYGTADTFRFGTGETVASSTSPINTTTYTVSYIANIPALQQAGVYTTTLTYTATATF